MWCSPWCASAQIPDGGIQARPRDAGNTRRTKDALRIFSADCADAVRRGGHYTDRVPRTAARENTVMRSTGVVLRSSLSCAATLALCAACTPPPAADVEPAPAAAEHPDLSGVWMAFAVENPDGGAPRYSPEGQAMLDAFAAQFSSIPETGAWCYGTGMPSVMLSTVSYPIEIVQHASRLVMLAELEMQVRRVYLDGRAHPDDFLSTGVGHSVGTWDGDTLVIDTTLLSEWQVRAVAAHRADPHRRARPSHEARRHRGPRDGLRRERREADQRRRARRRDDADGPDSTRGRSGAPPTSSACRTPPRSSTRARPSTGSRSLRKIECRRVAATPPLTALAESRGPRRAKGLR